MLFTLLLLAQTNPAAPDDASRTHVAYTAAFEQADLELQLGQLDDAERSLSSALDLWPESPAAAYARACVDARRGANESARAWLLRAIEWGWDSAAVTAWDPDLANVRESAWFPALLERMRALHLARLDPQGERLWRPLFPNGPYVDDTPDPDRTRLVAVEHGIRAVGVLDQTTPFDACAAGETLVAPFLDGRVRRIDLKSGLELDAIEVRATRVAVDPNGRWLVTTEKGGTEARVWDIAARRLLHVLPAYTLGKYPQVCEASFRCDGARLVTWSKDSSPRVWDTEFGRLVGELTIHAGVKVPGLCLGVAWSPDGARIATSELFGDVRTWLVGDVVREERTYPGTRSATCVAFSADGTRLVTDDEGPHAVVWDVATGERLRSFSFEDLDWYHGATVRWAEFTRDGKRLAATVADGGAVRVFDVASGAKLMELDFWAGNPIPLEARFGPDERTLFVCGMSQVHPVVLEAATGAVLLDLRDRGIEHVRPFRPGPWAVANEYGALLVYDARTLRLSYRRIETTFGVAFTDDRWHVAGPHRAVAELSLANGSRASRIVDLAPWLYDPKKVRAWRAGVDVEPAVVPRTLRR
ncbi:MAG: hypothetical protein U1F29_03060 [Planctomycetota bacterium]